MALPKIETLIKLVAAMKEEHEKLGAVIQEFDAILEGRQTIGEKIKELEGAYGVLWSARYGGAPYVWNYAKDRAQLKRLLRSLDVLELGARMASYLANADQFYVKSRHSFNVFVASVNSHAGAAPVVDAIADDVAETKRRMQELRS